MLIFVIFPPWDSYSIASCTPHNSKLSKRKAYGLWKSQQYRFIYKYACM